MSRKVALLIGNSTYGPGLPPLEKPDADIAALARVLNDPAIGGFDDVTPLLDAPSATARLEIARFFSGRSPDDLLLLYFSGHGLRNDRGALYLAVQDTEAKLLSGTAIPAAFISEEMDSCRSKRQILILDCCYSGAFERGAKGPEGNPATAFNGNGLGRFVLTASDSTQLAWEDVAANSKGGLSVFTRHLVTGLESGAADLNGDGLISVDELYDYVYARVVEENPRQTPGKSASKQQGEIFLARNLAGPKLRPLPAELMQALEHPLAAVRVGAVRELGRFLQGSDEGIAKAARKAAEQARADDSRSVAAAAAEVLATVVPQRTEPVPPPRPVPEPRQIPTDKNPDTSRKKALLRVSWIALGVVLLGVVLWASKALLPGFQRAGKATASETRTQANPDPGQALLTEAKSWPVALADNFDSAEASASFRPAELNLDDQVGTRKGSVSSGVLRLSYKAKTKGGFSPFLADPATTASDFYLRVDTGTRPAREKAASGLLFRAGQGGVQHYYAFMTEENSYLLSVFTDRWNDLRTWRPSATLHPGRTNSLAVIAVGTDLTLFINDQKVDQVSDATFSSGRVGLAIWTHGTEPGTFDFDNFELRRRPGRGDPAKE